VLHSFVRFDLHPVHAQGVAGNRADGGGWRVNWGNQLHDEMEVVVLRFGWICAVAGFAVGCIVGIGIGIGIAIGYMLFGGGA
jgi:hypothetical protein